MRRALPIIPVPNSVCLREGYFVLDSHVCVRVVGRAAVVANFCVVDLRDCIGIDLAADSGNLDAKRIHFELACDSSRDQDIESYSLSVSQELVHIQAHGEAGLFYGFQTLRQMLSARVDNSEVRLDSESNPDESHTAQSFEIPCCEIIDAPRFAWRGAHLDVGRHFMPKEFVKHFIDIISQHKMNRFHWHLTEDQGWRIEIKRYPRLVEVGAWRKETLCGHHRRPKDKWTFDSVPHGGFYSHEDIREIVAFAAERYVTVVPEIEMPGHSHAAIAAYPRLGNSDEDLEVCTYWGPNDNIYNVKDETIDFLKNVLEEVLELFPSKYIHIGGDECVKTQWENSKDAQAKMSELGIRDTKHLQSWFIQQMDDFLTSHGRCLVGWDEILEGGLAAGATVMSWRGLEGGIQAARQGHDVIMTPKSHTYLDYYQTKHVLDEPLAIGGYLPLEKVYNFDPIPSDLTVEQRKHILGTQCQLWTEYMSTGAHVERMAFPRLCAVAEVAWTWPEKKLFDDFQECLGKYHLDRLRLQHINVWREKVRECDHEMARPSDIFYVAVYIEEGCVSGKGFLDRRDAQACFDYAVSLNKFATILADGDGLELQYFGIDRREDLMQWLRQRQERKRARKHY